MSQPLHSETLDLHGIRCVRLRDEDGASATVALHGGQVLSWIPADGRERLFLSERASHADGAAIRGGIPVIFPQFAGRGPLPKHGFARTLPWRFDGLEADEAIFALDADARTRAAWPHAFAARLRVGLSANGLDVALEIANTGELPFAFTAALHTYLRVDDAGSAALRGLQGRDYEDSAAGGSVHRDAAEALAFDGEIDRIYGGEATPLELQAGASRLAIGQHGFADTVVWNPGAALAAGMGDLAPDDHLRFACVEAGQILQPVVLDAGRRWRGGQRLWVVQA